MKKCQNPFPTSLVWKIQYMPWFLDIENIFTRSYKLIDMPLHSIQLKLKIHNVYCESDRTPYRQSSKFPFIILQNTFISHHWLRMKLRLIVKIEINITNILYLDGLLIKKEFSALPTWVSIGRTVISQAPAIPTESSLSPHFRKY